MDLLIDVCTEKQCTIAVMDKTAIGEGGYLPNSSTAIVKNRFRY
jgi:hypothetical protein